ncbi:MAG: hypothetical protein NWR51_14125 [Akkermansiaceae bacterium]|jgi:hypothetical protein|nr:hypothetical protein [Akkermansiaceae bacterium]MDP4791998.1 hypothetical protein [Verrucomicrobiales bacterium]MDP4848388.1 hypothetical protein [Akkermansiaceae bacterium]MDP4898356.1 hypothetical protein [Akkermansiaceae bacterium]MDP4996615.1 hypothetical protein [Akkermansiaceae bacterium]
MSISSLVPIAALLAGMVPTWAAPEPTSLGGLKLTQLERRVKKDDRELGHLTKTSLRTGVGSIGYRSLSSNTGERAEWVEIEFDGE